MQALCVYVCVCVCVCTSDLCVYVCVCVRVWMHSFVFAHMHVFICPPYNNTTMSCVDILLVFTIVDMLFVWDVYVINVVIVVSVVFNFLPNTTH